MQTKGITIFLQESQWFQDVLRYNQHFCMTDPLVFQPVNAKFVFHIFLSKYCMATILPHSIFIHVPKTGGTWVAEALNQCNLVMGTTEGKVRSTKVKHPTAADLPVGDKQLFAFVRNPVTWYQSRWSSPYHFQRFKSMGRSKLGIDAVNDRQINNFQVWLRYAFTVTPKDIAGDMFRRFMTPYKNFIIGKYESLVDDLVMILNKVGEEFDETCIRSLSPINERTSDDRLYTLPLLKEVIRREERTMKRFGYSTNWRDYKEFLA